MKEQREKTEWYWWLVLLIVIFLWSIPIWSCSKSGYKPDHDQVSCKTFYDIREIWGDSARYYIRTDTVKINSHDICDPLILSALDTLSPQWHRICNSNGEVTHWEYWIPTLK